jgi:outer membrane lipoprotein-sorting protein
MLGLGAINTLPAQAQDGNAIARKMIQTYKNLNTYSETSEAKILMLGGPQQIQTASLKYQKPSLFVSTTSDPRAGSLSIYSDGKKVTIYGGRQNVFTQRNYTGSFATTVAQYEKISKEMLDMNITQIISPIGFMLASDLPHEGKQFKTMKTENVDGNACNVIQSAIDLTWLAKIVGKQTFLQDRCVVRLWVDKQSNLVRRGVINFVWKVTVKRPGKKDRLLVQGMVLDETHKNLQANTPINFEVFRFAPPAGAKQLFQETR